jgi:hypothetical protein
MAIWQDLVDEYGFASSYQSVQRFLRKLRGTQTAEAPVVIVTAPGQEAQVDYGSGPMVRDPETRKYRRTRLFVPDHRNARPNWLKLNFSHSRRLRRVADGSTILARTNGRHSGGGGLKPDPRAAGVRSGTVFFDCGQGEALG